MTFLTHLEESTIQRLVAGDLPDAEATVARTHLDDCALCRRRASEVSQLFALLAEPPEPLPEPPIDFLAAVMARVEQETPAHVMVTRAALSRGIAGGAAVAGAGAVLMVLGGGHVPVHETAAWVGTTFADVASHAGLAVTVVKAGAPVIVAAAVASLSVVVPLFWKAISSLQPKPVRATART